MPHCSSEHEEEQFESMVGGAASLSETTRTQSLPTRTQSLPTYGNVAKPARLNPPLNPDNAELPPRGQTLPLTKDLQNLKLDLRFKGLLDKIAAFNKIVSRDLRVGPQTIDASYNLRVYCAVPNQDSVGYHSEWKTIPEYIQMTKLDNINLVDLTRSINEMIKNVFPVNLPKLDNILASYILGSHDVTLQIYLQQQTVGTGAAEHQPDTNSKSKATTLENISSIGTDIFNRFITDLIPRMFKKIGENPADYKNFVTQNSKFLKTIRTLLGKINIPVQLFQKAIAYTIEIGLITSFIQLINYCYSEDVAIRLYALAGITIFIFKVTGAATRAFTASDDFIAKISGQGDATVESINKSLQDLVADTNNEPIHQIINRLNDLKQYYHTNIDNAEPASKSFILASINLCDSIIASLQSAQAVVDKAVKIMNIENAKKMGNTLIMFTTGFQSLDAALQRPTEAAERSLSAESPNLAAEVGATKGGGAPKRTTKKHTKKGKSKKHLKKAKKSKKGKKTGKKVRFHSASKKSKKNTRKRR